MKIPGLIIGGCAIFLTLAAFVLYPYYWPYPSKHIQRAWEKNFKETLVPGYSDFRGHWLDVDIAVYIFSYRYPNTDTPNDIFNGLANRLPGFSQFEQTQFEVAFRRSVTYSSPDGFDEYRFIYNKTNHRIFVMFANLDSDFEMAQHERLVQKLRQYASRDK